MSHEIARTSYLSWIPSIFRVRGEPSEGVSYFRIALGVAVFAGGFFVIKKLFNTNASIEPKTTTDISDEENPLVPVVPQQSGSPLINPDNVEHVVLKVSMQHEVVEKKDSDSDTDDYNTPPPSPRSKHKQETETLALSPRKKNDSTSSSGDEEDPLVIDSGYPSSDEDSLYFQGTPTSSPIGTPTSSPVKENGRSPSKVINVKAFIQPSFSSKQSDSDEDSVSD